MKPLINKPHQFEFNRRIIIFSPRWSLTRFLALQMISSIDDEGRPDEVFIPLPA
jgi:hypothetical protein